MRHHGLGGRGCGHRHGVRLAYQCRGAQSLADQATLRVRHPRLRPHRGHRAFRAHDGVLDPLRVLGKPGSAQGGPPLPASRI
eukprot:scaffold3070_cov1604-Pavlova_lutheri.AAC.6